jgi:copper chaperone
MKTLHFKTDVNCSSCIATVSPELEFKEKIQEWSIDITNPENILTITTDYTEGEITEIFEKVGHKAEPVNA